MATNTVGDNNHSKTIVDKPESTVTKTGEATLTTVVPKIDMDVVDYTEQLIQQAMLIALSKGLSDSAILEVIDDVSKSSSECTPNKRSTTLAKFDFSRTPRQRSDQLAVGFNYNADLVVQQSLRAVNGEIILLDTLAPPRAREDQLAVGFSYLADLLVKSSPRTDNREVVTPGPVITSRKLVRDHLAIGFNYHAEQLVKCSPKTETGEIVVPGTVSSPRKFAKVQLPNSFNCHGDNHANVSNNCHVFEHLNDCLNKMTNDLREDVKTDHNYCQSSIINDQSSADRFITRPIKKSFSETYAIGFSGASDFFIEGHLVENEENLPNGDIASIVDSASIGKSKVDEGNVDVVPVPIVLPAGSVW